MKAYEALLGSVSGDLKTEIEMRILRLRYAQGEDIKLLPDLEKLGAQGLSPFLEAMRLGLMCDINRSRYNIDTAIQQCETVVKIAEGLYPEGLSMQYARLAELADLAVYQGNDSLADHYVDALSTLAEKHYEPGSLPRLMVQSKIAGRQGDKGHLEEAARIQRELVEQLSVRLSPRSAIRINETFELAQRQYVAGQRDAAYETYEQVLQLVDDALPISHPNRQIMRVAYAVALATDGHLEKAGERAAVLLRNAEIDADVKEWDVYPIAVALTSGGEFARDQTDAKRDRFQQDLKAAFEAAEGPETGKAITDLIRALRGQGFQIDVELPPPA